MANLTSLAVSLVFILGFVYSLPGEYPPDYGPIIRNNEEFDFIIIGAGSAGCLVARRLSDFCRKWRILLIEAGGDPTVESDIPALYYTLINSQMDWQYKMQSDPKSCLGMENQQCSAPRGKCLGGSSSINFMLYVRGNPADFDHWASLGNEGWAYSNVLPYFKRFEKIYGFDANRQYHSADGLLKVDRYGPNPQNAELRKAIFEAVQEKNFTVLKDVNAESQIGFASSYGTIAHDLRSNTARSFIKLDAINLFVVKDSLTHKLLIKNNVVYGVKFVRKGRKITALSKKEVIVSAGSFNTPQLLMLSGIGPKSHLEEKGIPVVCDVPGVGQNLQDHMMAHTTIFQIKSLLKIISTVNAADINAAITNKSPLSSVGLSDLIGFVGWFNDTVPDVGFQAGIARAGGAVTLKAYLKRYNYADNIADQYAEANDEDLLFLVPTLLSPKSRGYILLNSTDPADPPLIYPNYLAENEDLEILIKGIRLAINITQSNALKDYNPRFVKIDLPNCRQYEMLSDDWLGCFVRHIGMTLFHPVGTCRMGFKEDPMACVNKRLQSHCLKNLRVIDASIMPTVTHGNTNCPTIMIGEKGSQMIIEDYIDCQ